MKKYLIVLLCLGCLQISAMAQKNDEDQKKGFKKENLFTGGSISLSFFNNAFLVGGSPVFGYSLTNWADAGLVVNYTYTSYRDYYTVEDKLRQKLWGGGGFVRLYPVRFLFAQGQWEHNWIRLKYLSPYPGGNFTQDAEASSFLVGGGYTTGRDPSNKSIYGYVAILWDVSKNKNSPYTDNLGRSIPIFRAGLHVPLFQGSAGRSY